jgi:hypothetical protein
LPPSASGVGEIERGEDLQAFETRWSFRGFCDIQSLIHTNLEELLGVATATHRKSRAPELGTRGSGFATVLEDSWGKTGGAEWEKGTQNEGK